jgi:16S rRNA (adenine1518-N6/adenine1519-N6)-dimethyltransferase
MSAMSSVHALLKKYRVAPKKRLGQHFLAAGPTIAKIVEALEPSAEDTVVEIGSGLGILTGMLARRVSKVIAIERDGELLEIARAEHAAQRNIEWCHADVLSIALEDVVPEARRRAQRVKVVGNLPYNISSPILFWLLGERPRLSLAVLMLQKEVASRIAAAPGGKEYGTLSVLAQAVASVRRLFDVSAASFLPPPEVTSSVIRIDFVQHAPAPPADEARFRDVVRAAFEKRRKTLRNALLGARRLGISADVLDAALAAAGIDPKRRPETLSVAEFITLASVLGGKQQ